MTSEQLKVIMNEKNIKIKDFVEKFGVSAALVYKWRDGTRAIPAWLSFAIKGAF